MYGIFQLQKKMRHTKITRMWYRRWNIYNIRRQTLLHWGLAKVRRSRIEDHGMFSSTRRGLTRLRWRLLLLSCNSRIYCYLNRYGNKANILFLLSEFSASFFFFLAIHYNTSIGMETLSRDVTTVLACKKNKACSYLTGLPRTAYWDAAELLHRRSKHGRWNERSPD